MKLMKIEGEQLTLTDSRFYISENGIACPSITTYLSAFPKGAAYYEWLKRVGHDADEILTEAGERGSFVHGVTERLDLGEEVSLITENNQMRCSALEWQMVGRYVNFVQRFSPAYEQIEIQVIDEELKEAGTIDRVMMLDGKRYIMDLKTSNYIWDTHWLQTAAYGRMYERIYGQKIDGIAILHLNSQTRTEGSKGAIQGKGWQLLRKSADDMAELLPVFDAVKQVWYAINGDLMPRNLTLSLKHKIAK
jgi:hypothetical protein